MEKGENKKNRHSQKDYRIAFKLAVISDDEKRILTYKQAQKQYGIKVEVLFWFG